MMPNSTANTPDEITGEVYSPSSSQGSGSETPNSDVNQTSVDSSSAPTEAEISSAGQEQEVTFGQEILENSDQVQQEIMALAEANAALKAQLEDMTSQYRRLGADFENFRKRTQKEKEEQDINIKCSTLKQLLPVVDNFERARSQIQPQTEGETKIHKSYQGVYKIMVDCLKQIGVSVMRPEGQPFDPNLHEAVMREPTDAYPEGTVVEDLMRGYLFGERVLRHAMVKVAAPPEPDATASEPEETSSEG